MATRKNEAIWIESRFRWQINIQEDGERKTFTCSTAGKKGKIECEKKADKWLENKKNLSHKRFRQSWPDFLNAKRGVISDKYLTQLEYLGRVYLVPVLSNKKTTDISPQHWQSCIDKAYKKGLSKATLKDIRGTITAFCRYARKCNLAISSPEDITIPKTAPVKQKNILQPQDIQTLFSVDYITKYGKQETCFFIYAFRFLLLTGLRRAELASLKKVDIKDNVLHVKGTKTATADRKIALGNHQQAVLAQQATMLKEKGIISPYLFPDEYGKALDTLHLFNKWKTYRKQHNIKSTLHELRHTLISISKSDMPEELLKMTVGHTAKTDTFGIYGHEVNGDLERAAGILDGIFDRLIK